MSTRWVGPQRRQHVREELRRPTLRGRPTQVWAGGGDRCEPRSEEMGGRRELHRTGGLASSRLPERNLGNNHPNSLFFLPSQLCWASPPTDVPTPADSEGSVYATPSGQRPGTESGRGRSAGLRWRETDARRRRVRAWPTISTWWLF